MVRATFGGFTTAFSALQANQKRLDIVGQNLANMNTPGYTRQQLQTSSVNYSNPISHYMSNPDISIGFGVSMDNVAQIRDPYLDIQYRSQMEKSGYTNAMQESLDRLADVLDESHISNIHQAFLDIRSSLQNMHDAPHADSPIYEAELRTRIQTLTNLLNDGARQIEESKMTEYSKLDGTNTNRQGAVEQVNDILRQIGTLNRQIKNNQIHGQPSLELMDERNVLIDELSSFLPIDVTYFKDKDHDGVDDNGNPVLQEEYHLDNAGNPIARKEWPDDLRITMSYKDANGVTQQLILVEGTVGRGDDNYGKLEITNKDAIWADKEKDPVDKTTTPGDLNLTVSGIKDKQTVGKESVDFKKLDANDPDSGNQFESGSIQSSLDMLWKDGVTKGLNDVKGYDFYMNQLDKLADTFAKVMNTLNGLYEPAGGNYDLLAKKDTSGSFTAYNICVSKDWLSGTVQVSRTGNNTTDTILNMLEAMQATYPYDNFKDKDGNPVTITGSDGQPVNLDNNTFADFMNHVSTILANDSHSNSESLKTNVTVLNGIQNSRDSVSGVSLDEEASNMMMFMSAYNAASRLMTTLDQALDVLINGTGVVGR